MRYKTMEELIDLIDRPAKTKIFETYHKHKAAFLESPGSKHNHQAWAGGYLDHVTDVMNTARLLYGTLTDKRKLDFSLSDALVVLFLHDIEKAFPDRIDQLMEGNYPFDRPKAKSKVRYRILHEEGLWELLNDAQKNAIDHAEGEGDGYTNQHRVMGPLAAFVHVCDVTSARIWFDRPYPIRESWGWRESIASEDSSWAV